MFKMVQPLVLGMNEKGSSIHSVTLIGGGSHKEAIQLVGGGREHFENCLDQRVCPFTTPIPCNGFYQ